MMNSILKHKSLSSSSSIPLSATAAHETDVTRMKSAALLFAKQTDVSSHATARSDDCDDDDDDDDDDDATAQQAVVDTDYRKREGLSLLRRRLCVSFCFSFFF